MGVHVIALWAIWPHAVLLVQCVVERLAATGDMMRLLICALLLAAEPLLANTHEGFADVPIFYISLNRSATGRARGVRLHSTFSAVARHVELVPAVDGNSSADRFMHTDQQFNHLLRRNTPSEMGCSLSHVVAIRRAEEYCLATGCDMAVIMEDDVSGHLLPFWTISLFDLAASLPDNWAVVQLQLIAQAREWEGLMEDWRARPSLAIPHDRRRHFGTGAYLIHLRGMRQIVETFTVQATPPGAVALANAIGGASVARSRRAPGTLSFPVDRDEIQADVHLIYSIASPAFLATPPLMSCAHSTSSIEHQSAIRLTAQNAAKENELAHSVSETFALKWAKASAAAHTQATSTGKPAPLPPAHRVSSPSLRSNEWVHRYCSHIEVEGMASATRDVQIHLLVVWLDGFDFAVHLRRWGSLQFRLSLHADATASVGYPTYRLVNKVAQKQTEGAGATARSTETSRLLTHDVDGESAIGRRLNGGGRKQKRGRKRQRASLDATPRTAGVNDSIASLGNDGSHIGKYVEHGWKRLPLVRGGMSRLTLRLTKTSLEFYCEGVFLEAQRWGTATQETINQGAPSTTDSPDMGVSVAVLMQKPTKLFFAWKACAESNSPSISRGGTITHSCEVAVPPDHRRRNVHPGSSCVARLEPHENRAGSRAPGSREDHPATIAPFDTLGFSSRSSLEWRVALELPITSLPLLLPSDDASLTRPRFIRHRQSRCGNEVKFDPSVVTSFRQPSTSVSTSGHGYTIVGHIGQ